MIKPGVITHCLHCGADIDPGVFPHFCVDCFYTLQTTGMLPCGMTQQKEFDNGDE